MLSEFIFRLELALVTIKFVGPDVLNFKRRVPFQFIYSSMLMPVLSSVSNQDEIRARTYFT